MDCQAGTSYQLNKVDILYNDYRNQKEGSPAPKETKTMIPLLANKSSI